jgi:hypothetical protein
MLKISNIRDDVLEEAASYQMLPKNQNYVIRKNWENLRVNEKQWVKDSERKTMSESEVNERAIFTHW